MNRKKTSRNIDLQLPVKERKSVNHSALSTVVCTLLKNMNNN